MDDDDKPRRNLLVISVLFITYALAGGSVEDHITYMKLSRPWIIEYIAAALFVYFYWSYWITHKGEVKGFFRLVKSKIRQYSDAVPMITLPLYRSVGENKVKQYAISRLENAWENPNNATPDITKDGFLEWSITANGDINMNGNPFGYNKSTYQLDITAPINSDQYICLWFESLLIATFTTNDFRYHLLPYSLAIVAVILNLIF